MANGVEVGLASVRRSWKQMGGSSVDLEFRPTTPFELDGWDAALESANDASHQAGTAVAGLFPTPSPKGFLTVVVNIGDDNQLEQWLSELPTGAHQRGSDRDHSGSHIRAHA